ncbi:hypothetical protein E1301_Tti019555 [Triplophysa tibetana]|uniref:THD domain-containing protein n=1 Tax=Triplophysa tibetana TaxID=1572043 RepID=A0A5A9NA95_9TELE|nr:hypothetical protein E1301_Tti019555 [Triplophysa tibetana]
MVHGGVEFPSVYVVDSKARPPPLPPKPGRRQRREVVQTLLVILVFVALFGMAVEACFIYYLYTSNGKPTPSSDPQTAMSKQDEEQKVHPKQKPRGAIDPSKPMAQLTTGHTGIGIMLWNQSQESILYRIKHKEKEGKLIIEQDGFYSIYSKIHFVETGLYYTHSVARTSPRYTGGEILLLQSSRQLPKPMKPGTHDNSFLSGVFNLFKGVLTNTEGLEYYKDAE